MVDGNGEVKLLRKFNFFFFFFFLGGGGSGSRWGGGVGLGGFRVDVNGEV